MLRLLELRNFALIERLELRLEPGLNALTGETGAGKSILVDALAQLSGARADPGFVRAGTEGALIQGEFEAEGGIVALTRRLQTQGRSGARIDGENVTVGELAEVAAALLAIHGQHAAQELADAGRHQRLLDRLLDAQGRELLERCRMNHAELRRLKVELDNLEHGAQERARRLDAIDWQLQEIRAAALTPGEDEALRAGLTELRNADAILRGAALASELLQEMDGAVIERLIAAERALDGAARHSDALAGLAAELLAARESLQATSGEIEAFLGEFDADPARLEYTEARLARIEALARKYGEGVAGILDFEQELAAERGRLERADDDIGSLRAELQRVTADLTACAAGLTGHRSAAGERLSAGVLPHLAELGMEGARFEVQLRKLPEPGPAGAERVEFMFSANPGEPLAELSSVASGGELSRLLLALHLVAGAEQPVLVFDEVDAGTGGRAALAIGSLLRRLARDRQVLVVTHLPQVAAFAHTQYSVSKSGEGGRTVATVTRLDTDARLEELARMLSGSAGDAARSAAAELLAFARTTDAENEAQPVTP